MVASLQAGKAIFAMRGDEVVADRCLVLQKFVGHLHADGVFPNVVPNLYCIFHRDKSRSMDLCNRSAKQYPEHFWSLSIDYLQRSHTSNSDFADRFD